MRRLRSKRSFLLATLNGTRTRAVDYGALTIGKFEVANNDYQTIKNYQIMTDTN